jgi:hypothetical protein
MDVTELLQDRHAYDDEASISAVEDPEIVLSAFMDYIAPSVLLSATLSPSMLHVLTQARQLLFPTVREGQSKWPALMNGALANRKLVLLAYACHTEDICVSQMWFSSLFAGAPVDCALAEKVLSDFEDKVGSVCNKAYSNWKMAGFV